MEVRRLLPLGLALSLLAGAAWAQRTYSPPVWITVGAPAAEAGSGRLLLFARKADSATAPASVSADPFFNKDNFVAAREVSGLKTGATLAFYPGDQAYPQPIDRLPAGDYWVQAVLDRDHSHAYSGRGAGDVLSPVVRLTLPAAAPVTLALDSVVPERRSYWERPDGKPMFSAEDRAIVERHVKPFALESKALSDFHGRLTRMQGFVLTPPDYDEDTNKRYPVVYFTHGFQAGMASLADSAAGVLSQTGNKRLPPMIWVFLDQSLPTGTHEFVDSANNGPWATALTQELLPDIDRRYRTDKKAGRYLMGHSSGGWAALWLQLRHPKLFRGAFATSPDFLDFSGFAGFDLNDPQAVKKDLEMERMEEVLGEYGGQMQSFEWVFSPRGADGRPLRLYDRQTGQVDRAVAAHWLANYDLSRLVRRQWAAQKAELDGKLHIYVGDKDEFQLDQGVRKFESALHDVRGKASIHYVPGKGHFDLYAEGKERMALRRKMGWEIWKIAYPGSTLADVPPPAAATGTMR
ncbi:MAG: alpha/beta hydrolase-fold protein [Pseudomonadota bacterium]